MANQNSNERSVGDTVRPSAPACFLASGGFGALCLVRSFLLTQVLQLLDCRIYDANDLASYWWWSAKMAMMRCQWLGVVNSNPSRLVANKQ
jgi:hypothetical protein